MHPDTLEPTLKLLTNYGLGVVSFVVLICVVRWIFKWTTAIINGILKDLLASIHAHTQSVQNLLTATQTLQADVRAHQDTITKANAYHRTDHETIATNIKELALATRDAVREFRCHAQKS